MESMHVKWFNNFYYLNFQKSFERSDKRYGNCNIVLQNSVKNVSFICVWTVKALNWRDTRGQIRINLSFI